MTAFLLRLLRALPLLLLSPVLIVAAGLTMAVVDVLWWIFGRRRPDTTGRPRTHAATVVIPNWNGRDLLERYLPSVQAALAGNPENEIIVVDNASTDGSADFLRERFHGV